MQCDTIAASAELAENAVVPRLYEVHTDPCTTGNCEADLPPAMQTPVADISPARWAHERLVLYIKIFEEQLDNAHEVAMGFTGGETGAIRIEGTAISTPTSSPSLAATPPVPGPR